MQRTDRELVYLTLAGKTEAFGELVRKYQGMNWRCIPTAMSMRPETSYGSDGAFRRQRSRILQALPEKPSRLWDGVVTVSRCKDHMAIGRPDDANRPC